MDEAIKNSENDTMGQTDLSHDLKFHRDLIWNLA